MMKSESIQLNELKTQKNHRFFSYIASWLKNEQIESVSIVGSDEQLKCLSEVMKATKVFHNELNNSDSSLDVITEKLEKKHIAAKNFESIIGISWPL